MRTLFSVLAATLMLCGVATASSASCSVGNIPPKVVAYTNSNAGLSGQMKVSLNGGNRADVRMTVFKNGKQLRASTGAWHHASNGSWEVRGGKIIVTFYTGRSGKNVVQFTVAQGCQLHAPVLVAGANKGAVRFSG